MRRLDYVRFIAGVTVMGLASLASAATVFFTLDNASGPPGTFTLTARASLGDNGGISSYGIPLTGPILTLDHRTPYAVSSANFAPSGFANLRSADGDHNVFAGQPLTGPAANYLYGIGQTPGGFATLGIPVAGFPDASSDNTWTAPIVIARGTYDVSVGRPRFAPPSADLFANLFATAGNSADKIGAQVSTQTIDFIEPPFPNIITNALGEREISAGPISAVGLVVAGVTGATWSNLQPVAGPNLGVPVMAATLDANGNFSWNPVGSKAGKKGSGSIHYQWTATATTVAGADTDVAFSVILIPEPATLALVGLAMIGLAGISRRRPIS